MNCRNQRWSAKLRQKSIHRTCLWASVLRDCADHAVWWLTRARLQCCTCRSGGVAARADSHILCHGRWPPIRRST